MTFDELQKVFSGDMVNPDRTPLNVWHRVLLVTAYGMALIALLFTLPLLALGYALQTNLVQT